MVLSSELASQFAKIVNQTNTNDSKETTVYGTAVKFNGKMYVKIDGSDRMTPITSTVDVREGERVTVLIKNHQAVATGNTSSPAARTDDVKDNTQKIEDASKQITELGTLVADKASIKELEADEARIKDLEAANVTITGELTAQRASISNLTADNVNINKSLTAANATIDNLKTNKLDVEVADLKFATIESLKVTDANVRQLTSDFGDFKKLSTESFVANNAAIKTLQTDKLSTKDAEVTYANIDFANIGDAAIEKFYAKSGIIKDLVIGNETVTGELVGITITGDLIKANTIVADKFVLKGQNGLFYRINTDGITVETEQTDENSLNGKVILAKSITADKVKVTDLVAFGATIAGFNINDNSIYSGVKESVDNDTRGIYLDKDGQIAFGDSNNYVKYYRDTDNTYKLKISAGSIIMSATGKTVEDAINGVETKLDELDVPDDLVTKADLIDDINSELKIDGKSISLTTGHFVITSKNFSLDAAGNASFSGTITGSSGEFTKGFYVNIPNEIARKFDDKFSNDSFWRFKCSDLELYLGWYSKAICDDKTSHTTPLLSDISITHDGVIIESESVVDIRAIGLTGSYGATKVSDIAIGIKLHKGALTIYGDAKATTESDGTTTVVGNNSSVKTEKLMDITLASVFKTSIYVGSGITLTGGTTIKGNVNATGYTVTATNLTAKSKLTVSGNSYFGGSGTFGGGLSVPCIEMIYSTPYIDFHYNKSTADYTSRFIDYGGNFTYYTNSGIHQFCNINGSQVARIQSNGTFGAATGGTAIVGSAIYCQTTWSGGAFTAVYGASFTNPSSRLVKENIADMTDSEAMKILQLTPVDFDYIEAYGGEKNQHGLIAEDTLGIIPSCVTVPEGYSEDNFDIENGVRNEVLAIDYSKLVPYLVKMVQIQQKQIDKLLSTQQKGE